MSTRTRSREGRGELPDTRGTADSFLAFGSSRAADRPAVRPLVIIEAG